MTMSEEYKTYLASDEWKIRRKVALDAAENRCQLCNSDKRPHHVHHRTYERCGRETAADLIVLCKDCHEQFHGRAELQTDQRLIKQTGWCFYQFGMLHQHNLVRQALGLTRIDETGGSSQLDECGGVFSDAWPAFEQIYEHVKSTRKAEDESVLHR